MLLLGQGCNVKKEVVVEEGEDSTDRDEEGADNADVAPVHADSSDDDRTTDLEPLPQPDPNGPRSEYYMTLANNTHVVSYAYRDYITEQVRMEPTEGKKKKRFQALVADTYAYLRARGGYPAIRDRGFFDSIRAAVLVGEPGAVGFEVQTTDALFRCWDNKYVANGGRDPPSSPPLMMPPNYIPVNIHGSAEAGQFCCRRGSCMSLAANNGRIDARPQFWRMLIGHKNTEIEEYLKTCKGCYLNDLKFDPTVAYETPDKFFAAMERFAGEHGLGVTRKRVGGNVSLYAYFSGRDYSSTCGAKLDDGCYRINAIPDDPIGL